MKPNQAGFPLQGHIKDEPIDDYELGPAQEIMAPESRENWTSPSQSADLKQTLSSSYQDAFDIGVSDHRDDAGFDGGFSAAHHQSAVIGKNDFHIPPFRCLAETAGAGEFHLSSSSIMPTMQAWHDLPSYLVFASLIQVLPTRLQELQDLIILDGFSCQAPLMPPDGAFLNSHGPSQRKPAWPLGQIDLPRLPAQGDAYALNSGQVHPQDTLALRMLPPTLDPSRLLQRQISTPAIQADSASDSDDDMDIGGESDCDHNPHFEDEDAAGWRWHPDTILLGIPDFSPTNIKGDMRDAAGVRVPVVIHARFVLKKKAAKQQNFWILYRRNYFGVQGSYNLEPLPGSSTNETLYLYRGNHTPQAIQALLMCMRGVVESEEGPEIKIVVFNAKRKPLHEGKEPPPIDPQRMKPLTEGSTKYYTASTGNRQDHMNVPMNHTFHRNQFRAATQNNGARRTEQQYYHILLELKAEILIDGVPKLFTVASKMSEALVVRGRCPLSFKDKDGRIRDRDRKGKKLPRAENGVGSRRGSTTHSAKEGQAKGASRGICNKVRNGSRRSTRASASSNSPSLTYGSGHRSTKVNMMSPLPTYHTEGTVNGETLPRLDRELLILTREREDEDQAWSEPGQT